MFAMCSMYDRYGQETQIKAGDRAVWDVANQSIQFRRIYAEMPHDVPLRFIPAISNDRNLCSFLGGITNKRDFLYVIRIIARARGLSVKKIKLNDTKDPAYFFIAAS